MGHKLLRRGTAGMRFTLLYASLFLMSGIGLLVLTNLFAQVKETQPVPGQTSAGQAQERIRLLEAQLTELQVAQSRRMLTGSLIALIAMAAVSLLLGRIIAGRVLRPLRTITTATRRITAESLHERLAAPGPADEVKDLADTIDDLLERLEASFAAQRLFVANASHELRTPLTTMRASLDVALAKPGPIPRQTTVLADRMRTELDQVDRLLEGLLTLARAQHGVVAADAQTVQIGQLIGEALEARATGIAAKRLTVERRGTAISAEGSPTLLNRMVHNLIDNAVVHNRDDGSIAIAVEKDAAATRLIVESSGPVLEQEQVARLAKPFQRLGADRTGPAGGQGLGLSIVAAIAAAHGGRIDLHARPEGGLRATVTLPVDGAA